MSRDYPRTPAQLEVIAKNRPLATMASARARKLRTDLYAGYARYLRENGLSWKEIAREMGGLHPKTCERWVVKARRRA